MWIALCSIIAFVVGFVIARLGKDNTYVKTKK